MDDREERIRAKAYQLWLEDGQPEGRDMEHWDKATELVAIEDGQAQTLQPNPLGSDQPAERLEEASLQENLGEFPDQLTDQGDREHTPDRRAE